MKKKLFLSIFFSALALGICGTTVANTDKDDKQQTENYVTFERIQEAVLCLKKKEFDHSPKLNELLAMRRSESLSRSEDNLLSKMEQLKAVKEEILKIGEEKEGVKEGSQPIIIKGRVLKALSVDELRHLLLVRQARNEVTHKELVERIKKWTKIIEQDREEWQKKLRNKAALQRWREQKRKEKKRRKEREQRQKL